jgi:hypothetical protein
VDLDDAKGKGLRVEWLSSEPVLTAPDGTETTIRQFPFYVETGGNLGIRQSRVSTFFAFGSVISFTSREFIDICLTLVFFGQQLTANLRALLVDRGISDSVAKG